MTALQTRGGSVAGRDRSLAEGIDDAVYDLMGISSEDRQTL